MTVQRRLVKLKLGNCKLVISKSYLIDCPRVVAAGSPVRGELQARGCWPP